MLVLNESQMWQAITLDEVLDAVEDAFAIHKRGHFLMPDRSVAEQNGDKLMFMPCFLDSIIGTKMLAEFPNNPEKLRIHAVNIKRPRLYDDGIQRRIIR